MPSGQEHFEAVLGAEFAPRLRAAGFKGSGRDFRRVTGDVIHAINLQRSRWGGSCILNLGIHLAFLPLASQAPLEPRRMREVDCEFRTRLASPLHADGWWAYGSDPAAAAASARSLGQTYFDRGEAHFQRFSHPGPILAALELMVFAPDRPDPQLAGHLTGVRAALAGARIHRHNGNVAGARRFAETGLQRIGEGPFAAGTALRDELQALAATA